MNFVDTLVFVFTHSAFVWITGLIFAVIGLWQGYEFWGRWEGDLQAALREKKDLKNQIANYSSSGRSDILSLAKNTKKATTSTVTTFKKNYISIFEGEHDYIEKDKELGILYITRPPKIDDLTILNGIDQEKELRLNRAGFYAFKQLASLDQKKRENFSRKFGDLNWDEVMAIINGPDYTYTVRQTVNS